MPLRIAPPSAHSTSTTNTTNSKVSSSTANLDRGAPSAPGLPDTLRLSHLPSTPSAPSTSSSTSLSSTHPLEARLTQWTQTQQQLRSQILRRNFGIAEPLRRDMELKLVRDADGFRPTALGRPSGVHEDILSNRDTEITWEDVYDGQDGLRVAGVAGGDGQGVGWSEEMERKVGMGKW